MAHTRDHLPRILQSTDAKKAWCKKVLKHYVVKRLRDWNSTRGKLSKVGKYAAYFFSIGNYSSLKSSEEILKDCNTIKTDIEAANTFQDYKKLIQNLHKYAEEAKEEEIPWASKPALRADTYYAIIAMLIEIIKSEPQLLEEYQREIDRLLIDLKSDKKSYKNYFPNGRSREEIYQAINDHLRELVILGYKPVYGEAFDFYRNLFPKIFVPLSGKSSFIIEKDARSYKVIIEVQVEQEQGIKINLKDLAAPNQNIPYQLQPDFAMIFCHKELKKSLGFCTKIALEEDKVEYGKSFHELYEFDKEKFIADNLVEDRAPREDAHQGMNDDNQTEITYLPVDNSDQALPPAPETSVDYDFEVEDEDALQNASIDEINARVKPLPTLPPAAVPAPPPLPPEARPSALGTFARPDAAPVQDLAPASDAAEESAPVEEAEAAVADADNTQPAAQPKTRRARRKAR